MQIDSIEFDMCHRMQQSNLVRQRAQFTFWDIARAEQIGFVGAPGLSRGGGALPTAITAPLVRAANQSFA